MRDLFQKQEKILIIQRFLIVVYLKDPEENSRKHCHDVYYLCSPIPLLNMHFFIVLSVTLFRCRAF